MRVWLERNSVADRRRVDQRGEEDQEPAFAEDGLQILLNIPSIDEDLNASAVFMPGLSVDDQQGLLNDQEENVKAEDQRSRTDKRQ